MTEQGHKLIATQQPEGTWSGTCTCKRWVAPGGPKRESLDKLFADHVRAMRADER